MTNREIVALTDKYVAKTYARTPIALVKGRGSKVWDANGKEYLDFLAGIAVNSLGHCNPAIVKAIKQQAQQLLHVSNLYHIKPQSELARELCRHSFADRVFFCNSGAEANEAAIKLARRYGLEKRGGRYEIISTHNSFHGRTLATLTATAARISSSAVVMEKPFIASNTKASARRKILPAMNGPRFWTASAARPTIITRCGSHPLISMATVCARW